MKQLLFLLLFPCLALAQYQGNANQKITLGEQTTADGLVFRGVANLDTVAATSKITRANKQDTSAYLLLDTVTNLLWHYKTASNGWIQAGGSTLDTATMLLPYYRAGRNTIIQAADVPTLNQNTTGSAATLTTARNIRTNLASAFGANFNGSIDITPGVSGVLGAGNGGTGASNFGSPNRIPFVSSSGSLTTDTFFAYNGTSQRLGVGVPDPTEKLHVSGNARITGNIGAGIDVAQARLHVKGSGVTNSSTALKVDNNGNTNLLTVLDNGNVGIGTTTPTQKLDVNGITNSTNYRTIYNSSVTIPASSTTTLLTLSSSVAGLYIINANFGNQGNAIYGSALIVVANGGSFRIITNGSGASATLTLSGANVQITNGLGIPLDATASAILIAN